jgi:UDP-N-acetylmuramyl pentapeptide phosphotransferase/UDP-N-acetylglucosamine-1-phosphate transferase
MINSNAIIENMVYIILVVLLLIIELLYFKIADRYNIIDKPNNRSSHSQITLRGGGIIFPVATAIAFALGYVSLWVTLAVVAVAIVSFIDDIRPLPTLPRFATHLLGVLLILYDLELFGLALWFIPIILVFLIGWINAFNFMDGINGITVLYALVALITFTYLPVHETETPLLLTMIASCLVFGFFNVRTKAKTFAGDVGSVSMAVLLGYFMIKTIIRTEQIGYLLFFAVYGIDAVVTILHRLIKKENILEAHRSHLYQYLANEYGYSHLLVSFAYAGIQLLINIFVIYMETHGYLSILNAAVFLILLSLMYLLVRIFLIRKMTLKNG